MTAARSPTPAKRRAAVAVTLVDSHLGEDRVDPAPVEDWIAGRPMPGLPGRPDGRRIRRRFFPVVPQGVLAELAYGAVGAARAGVSIPASPPSTPRCANCTKRSVSICRAASVLGLLDDYPTRSGYVITPVVLWGGGRLDLHPSPDEVVAVYRVGLHQLQREDLAALHHHPGEPAPGGADPAGQ